MDRKFALFYVENRNASKLEDGSIDERFLFPKVRQMISDLVKEREEGEAEAEVELERGEGRVAGGETEIITIVQSKNKKNRNKNDEGGENEEGVMWL